MQLSSEKKGSNKRKSDQIEDNPYIATFDKDYYYHLSLDSTNVGRFSDIKFVLMGGSAKRMEKLAKIVSAELNITPILGPHDFGDNDERYSMYKIGPVLCINHGMGTPSLNILLHELVKMLKAAGAEDYCFIRTGTSGGVGVDPGTIVLTTQAVNGYAEPYYSWVVFGKEIKRPCAVDMNLVDKLFNSNSGKYKVAKGKTLSALDFYESQGRVDGAVCEYKEEDKFRWLNELKKKNILNIEMEADCFTAFCNRVRVPCAVANVVILNRLISDQVTTPNLEEIKLQLLHFVVSFVKGELSK